MDIKIFFEGIKRELSTQSDNEMMQRGRERATMLNHLLVYNFKARYLKKG